MQLKSISALEWDFNGFSFIFAVHQTVDGITVRPRPRAMVSIETAKPKIKLSHKSNKTIGDVQAASDTRIRRLIPYMSYHNPGNDYNYNPMEFLSLVIKI